MIFQLLGEQNKRFLAFFKGKTKFYHFKVQTIIDISNAFIPTQSYALKFHFSPSQASTKPSNALRSPTHQRKVQKKC
jgi:hypothetical protein